MKRRSQPKPQTPKPAVSRYQQKQASRTTLGLALMQAMTLRRGTRPLTGCGEEVK